MLQKKKKMCRQRPLFNYTPNRGGSLPTGSRPSLLPVAFPCPLPTETPPYTQPAAAHTHTHTSVMFKGIVRSNFNRHPFSTLEAFSNPHKRSGVSRFPPVKQKGRRGKHDTSPFRSYGLIRVSGGPGSPLCLETCHICRSHMNAAHFQEATADILAKNMVLVSLFWYKRLAWASLRWSSFPP